MSTDISEDKSLVISEVEEIEKIPENFPKKFDLNEYQLEKLFKAYRRVEQAIAKRKATRLGLGLD